MTTKTESVRERVFDAILRGEYGPGDRIPPERDMADITRTSRVTVRRAYAALERSGILARKRGSGAYISSEPRARREAPTAVAVLASLRDAFAVEFIEAMERALAERGVFLVLRLTDQDAAKESRAAMDLVALGVRDLVVWASGGSYDADVFARLRILGANMVFFDRMMPGEFADYVGLDNRHAVTCLVDRAISEGASRLVFVSHVGLGADSDRLREEAFAAACERRGVRGTIERVPWGARASEAVARNARRWTEERDVAVIGVNDEVAALVKRARPRVAVYGIDGLPDAAACGVVSVTQPMRAMAETAAKLLIAQHQRGARWRATRTFVKGRIG